MTNLTNISGKIARLQNLTLYEMGAVMNIIGYEVVDHRRLHRACRPFGEGHWQSCPSLRNARDAELWIAKDSGYFAKIMQDRATDTWAAQFNGTFKRIGTASSCDLGAAMWAAFVHCYAGEIAQPGKRG